MNNTEILNTLTQRAEYIRMREELDKLIEESNEIVKSAMTAEGVAEMVFGPFKVIWKDIERVTLDSKALKAAAPDVWRLYSKTQTTRPFTVKC